MPSITFAPVCIASNRRKDGSYPVKIRVTYKGVSRRLPTNLIARQPDLTRTLHIKPGTILGKAQALIRQMQDTLADLSPFVTEGWDVDRVVAHIRSRLTERDFELDFFDFADGYLRDKTQVTRRAYEMALSSLARWLGGRRLDINDITKGMLLEWRRAVDAEGKLYYNRTTGMVEDSGQPRGAGVSARHLSKLAHIFNAARMRYNDDERILIPRTPFDGIPKTTPPPHGQHNLGAELMQRIINAEAEGVERVALDVFLLSFATMGANLADLWAAKPCGPVWVYNRQKTKNRRQDRAEMRVTIQPEAGALVARLQDGPGGWWLPALHRLAGSKDLASQYINRALRKWAEREGVEPFTFYAARKTWASLARRAGVEKATIDECLCHIGDFRVADIYIERDYSLMDAANRRVLDTLQFSGVRDL